MTPQELKAKILSTPALLAFWQEGRVNAITANVNAEAVKIIGSVPRNEFAIWAGSTGVRTEIEKHSQNALSPLRAISLTIIDFLRGAAESLDFSKPANIQMLDAWVQAQAITVQQKNDLLELAKYWPPRLTDADIETAMRSN